MRKKKKQTLTQLISNAWMDLKVKLIILGSILIAFVMAVLLIVFDIQNDQILLESKANKYETYVDQLLLKQFSVDELKVMNADQLKLAVDMVIDEESNKVINAPSLNDFILPVKDDDFATQFKLTREPKSQWSQQDIDQFWVDLETLDIKNLEENNFEYLKARLKDVN